MDITTTCLCWDWNTVLAKCRWGGADDRRIAIHLDAGDRDVDTLLEAMASLLG